MIFCLFGAFLGGSIFSNSLFGVCLGGSIFSKRTYVELIGEVWEEVQQGHLVSGPIVSHEVHLA